MDFLTQIAIIKLVSFFISTPSDSKELANAICELMPTGSVFYSAHGNIIYFSGTGIPFAVGP